MREVFPAYVEAMDAYNAWMQDEHVYRQVAESRGGDWGGDFRDDVAVIMPANFWDRELCRRAFRLTPEQIVGRLQGRVAEARLFLDGVLVVYSYERVPDDKLWLIDGELRPFLQKGLRLVSSKA